MPEMEVDIVRYIAPDTISNNHPYEDVPLEKVSYKTTSRYLMPLIKDLQYEIQRKSLSISKIEAICITSGLNALEVSKEIMLYKKQKQILRNSDLGQSHRFIDMVDNADDSYYYKFSISKADGRSLFCNAETIKTLSNFKGILNIPISAMASIACLIGSCRLLLGESENQQIKHIKNYDKAVEEIEYFFETVKRNLLYNLILPFNDIKFNINEMSMIINCPSDNPTTDIIEYGENTTEQGFVVGQPQGIKKVVEIPPDHLVLVCN